MKDKVKEEKSAKQDKFKDEKLISIQKTLEMINKECGGATRLFNSKEEANVEVVSTGSILIDKTTGIGGIPKGRFTEIYGPESSGKTTLALCIMAQAQKQALINPSATSTGFVAIIDTEHALSPPYAVSLGVDFDKCILSQPDSGEQALEIAERLVRSATVEVIVVDSVAALVPRSEIEGEMGDLAIGAQARLMSQGLRKLASVISQFNVAVIFINQIRNKIGVYGNPETTTGGYALKFYASLRIEVRKGAIIKDKEKGETATGQEMRVKIVKNKFAAPFQETTVRFNYKSGFDRSMEVFELCVKKGIIAKNGSWFTYDGKNIGQGQESSLQYLIDNNLIDHLLSMVNSL